MGILSRIFSTENDKTKASEEGKKINLIEYYKEKYEKMQKGGKGLTGMNTGVLLMQGGRIRWQRNVNGIILRVTENRF